MLKWFRVSSKQVKEMSRAILVISVLAGLLDILAGAELSYINAQNMTNANATRLNMFNATGDGNLTGGNETASNTKTGSASEEGDNKGSIADAPNKCLGSALCPD